MPGLEDPLEPAEFSHRPAMPASETPGRAAEFASPWRALLAYALLAGVVTLTVGLPLITFWSGTPIGVDALGPAGLFQGQLVLAGFLAGWFLLQRRADWRAFLHVPGGRWERRIVDGLRTGARGWVLTMVVMVVLGIAAHAGGVRPNAGFTEVMLWMARLGLGWRIAVILVAMIVEEAFFRAFLQPRIGLVLATCCFALSHFNYGSPTMGGGVFVIGWVLGKAFARTDDLVVCAVAHGTFDAIQLLVVLPLVASQL